MALAQETRPVWTGLSEQLADGNGLDASSFFMTDVPVPEKAEPFWHHEDRSDFELDGVPLPYDATGIRFASKSGVSADDSGAQRAPRADSGSDLSAKATDPADATLFQIQLQNVFQPNTRNASGYGNQFIVQPVVPIKVSDKKILGYFDTIVWRGTVALASSPDVQAAGQTIVDSQTNLTDMTNLFGSFASFKLSDDTTMALGPIVSVILPTATDTITGSGKFSLGPGAIASFTTNNVFTSGDSWVYGGYGYQVWSVAGHDDRREVNELYFAPFANYHFAELFGQKGWWTGYSDELWSFDWNAGSGGVAQMPLGWRVGKLVTIGELPLNVFVGSNYYAAYRGSAPYYDIKLNVTLLLPE